MIRAVEAETRNGDCNEIDFAIRTVFVVVGCSATSYGLLCNVTYSSAVYERKDMQYLRADLLFMSLISLHTHFGKSGRHFIFILCFVARRRFLLHPS
jgi:hypothetical protein